MVNMLSSEDAAYIAGFLDGDGSIFLNKVQTCNAKLDKRYQSLVAGVSFINSNKSVMSWIADMLGYGNVIKCLPPSGFNKKPLYQLTINGTETIKGLLNQLIPYLKVKQPQADLVLEYLNKHEFKSSATTEDWEIFDKLRLLNSKGKRW